MNVELHRNISLSDNTFMEYFGIFEDVTDDGHPRFALYTLDEDFICHVTVPIDFISDSGLEIGDEVHITALKST